MSLRFLHTNDMHGKLTPELASKLQVARSQTQLYFDSGDCIKAGNLAIPTWEEPVWHLLADLECTAGVLGNRETHPLASGFHAKLAGRRHPILCSNLRRKSGELPFEAPMLVEIGGARVGIFGVMVEIVTQRMKTQSLSAYLWDDAIATADVVAKRLRPDVDLVVALTHIGYRRDQELAVRVPEIDIIFGGHSHTVLHEPVRVNNSYIVQGGSHCRFFGEYVWQDGVLSGGLTPWASGDA